MQTGLADSDSESEARRSESRVAGQAAGSLSAERTASAAESYLALSLVHQGQAVEAEPMFRRLHEVLMRARGARAEYPDTLTTAGNLALIFD
jgi:hypothetical protein